MEADDLDMEKQLHEAHEVLSKVGTILASCSDKLAHLENLLSCFLEDNNYNHIGANGFENDVISEELIERTFTFDLISAIIKFELGEFDVLFGGLQELIVDGLRKILSFDNSTELINSLVNGLHDSEVLIEHSRDRVLLKMLEKSLSRELELEKNLKELKRNENDFKQKVRLVEQVASFMEEAAEVTWARFLEADSMAEVLSGISKDTLCKLQLAQAELDRSTKSEREKTRQIQELVNQLHAKDLLIEKLNTNISSLAADNAKVEDLREKVRYLEEKLKKTESKLEEVETINETSQKQLIEREIEIEALREKTNEAETRAKIAEEKASHLTDSNLELSEELDFLKGTNDSNSKKSSILEKELRELDIQLQHSRALSEASQEQQNMLYSAIWDMETLIDELKQKVAKAEGKAESAEDRCVILSETNSDISKELEFMRSRVELLENALSQAALEKKSRSKEIGVRSNRIMEVALQIATERERLISCTKENKLLRDKLTKQQKNATVILQDKRNCDEKEFRSKRLDPADPLSAETSALKATEISSESLQAAGMEYKFLIAFRTCSWKYVNQVEKLSEVDIPNDNEIRASCSTSESSNLVSRVEAERLNKNGNYKRMCVYIAILVVVLSGLAAHLFQKNIITALRRRMGSKTLRNFLSESRAQLEALREKRNEKASIFSELLEKIDFLKGTNDSNAKKWSMLEKELRELEFQLQQSRALSEASQEQENMLYSALCDMETLIDELEHNLAKGEVKLEDGCLILSETNSNISKELECVSSRVVLLANALTQTTLEIKSCDREIVMTSNRIIEMSQMTLQTVIDRERLQNKVEKLSKDAIPNDDEIQASCSANESSNLVSQVEAERLNKNRNNKRVMITVQTALLSTTKKASMLKKELRELEFQRQHSRALSEVSQEQQNVLNSAVWDMVALIDELNQKMAKAEGKAESAEDRCVILSETISDFIKRLEFMRSRVELLANALNQTTLELNSCSKEIVDRSNRIMEMALQIAIERECLQNKVEAKRLNKNGDYKRMCAYMAILVVVLSGLAAHLFQKNIIVL
ncbi:WPP domain-interacting protein 2 [Striga asiatica]|uniref:WPP domain-interacting protein 2 n=1 Tax=Striga asiatica TaxID=4170 RepID=A0A5A7Q966_STRAF|nr:WPP domain-interacting protein 2 [Striga asiatica]